jgi:hypothetical protein
MKSSRQRKTRICDDKFAAKKTFKYRGVSQDMDTGNSHSSDLTYQDISINSQCTHNDNFNVQAVASAAQCTPDDDILSKIIAGTLQCTDNNLMSETIASDSQCTPEENFMSQIIATTSQCTPEENLMSETFASTSPKYLPLSKDVKSLTEYVNAELQIAYDCLISNEDTVSYTKLSKVLMVSLILFNRRRSGEVQKISLKNVEDGLKTNLSMDMFKLEDLGYIEKFLLKSLKRIEIMGKKGRGVPILLKTVHTNAIELLIEKREVMDIPEENPYLFARCSENAKTPHSACLELSKMARLSKLEHPEYMKSTLLRKHIATISQIVSLSDVELKQLATFMGHDLTVHMDYYRLPVDILQIAKVEKLLIASEQNTIKHGKPVCIDSINIDDEDHIFDDAIADDNITPPTPSPNVVVPPRKKRTHKAWQPHEKEAVAKYFKTHIEQKKLPFKHEVKQFLFENPTVTRTWDKIKFWIKNNFSK